MNIQSGTPELFKRTSQNGIFPFMEKTRMIKCTFIYNFTQFCFKDQLLQTVLSCIR
jgi:hypothetical protein